MCQAESPSMEPHGYDGTFSIEDAQNLQAPNRRGQTGAACPPATQDLELNTRNRNRAIQEDYIGYGPLNINAPGDFWKKIADFWNTTVKGAKQSKCANCVAFDISPRMDACMPGPTSDNDGRLGYCHMHNFKCHSERSCRTWAKGGPITDNTTSREWQG